MWKQADEEVNQLFALILEVRAKMDRKSSSSQQQRTSLNLRKCTWEQVMGEVQSLATRWSTSPKKASRSMMCLEKLGKNSDAFKSWLDLLPAGDYGSSICGVFTIALGAVGAFSKVEPVILETLAEIPEVMDDAKRYIEIYGKNREQLLEKKTFDLYLSILTALKHIMQFFADSSLSKVYQPIVKQSSYKSELLECCNNIKSQANRVKNEAQICMQKRNVDSNHLQQGLLSDLKDQNQAILNLFYKFLLSSEARSVPISGRSGVQANKSGKLVEDKHQHEPERAKRLLDIMKYDPDIVLMDTEVCLRLGAALDEADQARAAALVSNTTFKAFMTKHASSSALLVNGNEDTSNAEGVSPLSLVAARLAQISEENETTQSLTLRYFCAEHSPYGREQGDSSPAEIMMTSLTGQLVSHMLSRPVAVDLSFLGPEDRDFLEELSLKMMCTVFFKLVKQLPPKTILLCILDEVALYETSVQNHDMDTVIRRLVRLVEACDEIVFKLLVTCRGRVLGIGQYFTGNTLDLDEEIEADDSSTWQIARLGSRP
ncbi:hypothetical protein F5883DRAFT_65963 [Diaporthe sp. PMI_573]|nr:hypothetical protein F5883DRAFT_65963 [Diaporthaceae sp. PMI_573]